MWNWLLAGAIAIASLTLAVRLFEPRFAFFPTRGVDLTPADLGAPFARATLTTADGERIEAWSLPHPDARASLLYFHGNGGNLSVWAPILVQIHRRGFDVHAIDYRGYGVSTGGPSEQGLYRDADAFVAWAAQNIRTTSPLLYWGRSLGSTVAAYAATVRAPDGLVLEAGFPNARTLLKGSLPFALLSLFSSYRFPTAAYAAAVETPILVIHGDADRVVPYQLGRALFDRLPQGTRFVTIPGGDHNDLRPADERVYWDAVGAFVASLPRTPEE
jgi:pimeloyl-ACP methyl ester carboxylesterase